MKNSSAAPLQLPDAHTKLGEGDIDLNYIAYRNKTYAQKIKHHLKRLLIIIQNAILWVTFLYIPVYGALLYFHVAKFLSLFSLYYLLAYIVTILALVMINREEHTFR